MDGLVSLLRSWNSGENSLTPQNCDRLVHLARRELGADEDATSSCAAADVSDVSLQLRPLLPKNDQGQTVADVFAEIRDSASRTLKVPTETIAWDTAWTSIEPVGLVAVLVGPSLGHRDGHGLQLAVGIERPRLRTPVATALACRFLRKLFPSPFIVPPSEPKLDGLVSLLRSWNSGESSLTPQNCDRLVHLARRELGADEDAASSCAAADVSDLSLQLRPLLPKNDQGQTVADVFAEIRDSASRTLKVPTETIAWDTAWTSIEPVGLVAVLVGPSLGHRDGHGLQLAVGIERPRLRTPVATALACRFLRKLFPSPFIVSFRELTWRNPRIMLRFTALIIYLLER